MRSPLAILFVTVFLDLVGFGIVIPLLPLYAERYGAGPLAVVWLVGIYSLMQFLFAPAWGTRSDRVGRRPVLLVGLFGSAASYILFGFAGSLAALFVARAAAGALGATVGVAQAYIADVTAPEERARGMGLIGAAFGLGFILGPAIGGILAGFGPSVPFLAAGALAFANGVVAYFRLPESRVPGTAVQRGGLGERIRTLLDGARDGRLRTLFGGSLLLTLALAAMEATFALWAVRRWEMTPTQVAFLFAYMGAVAVLIQGFLVSRLVRRVGERGLALLGAGALATGLLILPLAPSLPVVALAIGIFAAGQGSVGPAIAALVSRHAAPAEQGRLLGAAQSLSALGRTLGPALGGLAFVRVGISAPYLGGALLSAAALATLAAGLRASAGADR